MGGVSLFCLYYAGKSPILMPLVALNQCSDLAGVPQPCLFPRQVSQQQILRRTKCPKPASIGVASSRDRLSSLLRGRESQSGSRTRSNRTPDLTAIFNGNYNQYIDQLGTVTRAAFDSSGSGSYSGRHLPTGTQCDGGRDDLSRTDADILSGRL